jgi:protocatechuate 3,4-dioxygenase beta subunit
MAGKTLLSTQCYVKGEPKNDKDGIYQSVKDDKQRQSITVDFAPIPGSKLKELSANFNLVLGYTPEMP